MDAINGGGVAPAGVADGLDSDATLLRRYRQGDGEAARQLYLRYARRVRGLARKKCARDLCSRVDADDVVQSVFHTFFQEARQGYYHVPDGEDLWKLLLVIALNKIRAKGAFHRAAKRDVRLTCLVENLEHPERPVTAGRDAPRSFLQLVVDEALCQLPPVHRDIIELRMQGYEVAEIAEKIGRAKRTVERLLQDSRNRLAVLLQTDEAGG